MHHTSFDKQPDLPDLFETWNATLDKQKARAFLVPNTTITLRLGYEHIVLIAVTLLLGVVATFALGIDRGQRLARYPSMLPRPASDGLRRALTATPEREVGARSLAVHASSTPLTTPATAASPVRYAIQVASYQSAQDASTEAGKLKRQGHAVVSTEHRGRFTIVLVGSYASKREAANQLPILRKRYKDCFVKELRRESTS